MALASRDLPRLGERSLEGRERVHGGVRRANEGKRRRESGERGRRYGGRETKIERGGVREEWRKEGKRGAAAAMEGGRAHSGSGGRGGSPTSLFLFGCFSPLLLTVSTLFCFVVVDSSSLVLSFLL